MESIAQVRIKTHPCLVMLKPLHQVPSHVTPLNYDLGRERSVGTADIHSSVRNARICAAAFCILDWNEALVSKRQKLSGFREPLKCNDIQRVFVIFLNENLCFALDPKSNQLLVKPEKLHFLPPSGSLKA